MAKEQFPMTAGVRYLQTRGISFSTHLYDYKDHGGASWAAEALGLDFHAVIKTLVFETDEKKPLMVLMHGDREVSGKNLARALGVKSVSPSSPEKAERLTGYQVGGISPFGVRTILKVYAEKTIFDFATVYINGGKRGFLVGLRAEDLKRAIEPEPVSVAI